MSEDFSPESRRLPLVFKLSLFHFGFFVLLCILLLLAGFYLPLGLLYLYPCLGLSISAFLFVWSVGQVFFPSSGRTTAALLAAALMSLAVPVCIFLLGPRIANYAARIQAARTAPLADFQSWAVKLIDTASIDPQDDFFWGGDPRVPANLRPFTSHFQVLIRRPVEPGDADPHVDLIAGGGFFEMHSVLSIGRPTYSPGVGNSTRKWADGIYYTFP